MSVGDQGAADPGAERDIDLRSWWRAFKSRWWIAAVGLVAGVVVGALYSLSGGSSFTASALIAPGTAFNPSGSTPVLTYLTSEAALSKLANEEATIVQAAAIAKMNPANLRGHITVNAVNLNAPGSSSSTSSTRNAVLVELTVRNNKAKRAEDGANALAQVIKAKTTSRYVQQSISAYQTLLSNFKKRQTTLAQKIAVLNGILNSSAGKSLAPLDQLVLAQELDTAEGTLGATINSITTTQQQLTLAQQIETTQIIQQAKAVKTTARSRRNSVLFGALIGLLIGAVVAIVVGLRAARQPSPPVAA
jgi:uncharacterized protein involved in exopolysaccharide biosynthesis